MARENIDISKDGIKTSLLTFISDHATSVIILAFFIIAYYFPIFDQPLRVFKNFDLSIENKIFIALLLLLLLHPVGLFIDFLGWLLLGWMEKWFETYHFGKKTFLTIGIKNYLCFETLKTSFKLTKENFYETVRQKEYFLTARNLDVIGEFDPSLGGSILLRNLTVCSLIIAVVYLFMGHLLTFLLVLIGAIFFIIMNSCISFYYSLSILMIYSKLYDETDQMPK